MRVEPLARPPRADRILVVRLGALGDVVRTLPAVSSLRAAYPRAHVAWLVERAAAGAVVGQPWIDEVIVFPRDALASALRGLRIPDALREARTFLERLRRRRFDLALDFHGILRSGVLARLSGAPRRVGYARPAARELSWWLASDRARLTPDHVSRFERNAALVRYLGFDLPPAPAPLAIDPAVRRRVRARLPDGAAPVAIHPGSSGTTAHKRYPVEGYAALARALAADGVPCLVTRGPAREDAALAEAVVARSLGAARPAPATPELAELAALLEACRLYVGGDTGPLHVASLVGTPVLQLLGPSDPVENAPWAGTPSRSLRAGLACSPCRRGCAAAPCMRSLSPAAVLRAARELLAAESGARAAS